MYILLITFISSFILVRLRACYFIFSFTFQINSTEVGKMNDILHLTFRAQGLDKKDFLGKSDPYLEFSRQAPDGRWQVVHRTEVRRTMGGKKGIMRGEAGRGEERWGG